MRTRLLMGILLSVVLLTASVASAAEATKNWSENQTSLTFYGQSTFMLSRGDMNILFDPWFTGSPWKIASADEINPQYILVTHAHGDHIADAAPISKRTGAKVIATSEITRLLQTQGVINVSPMSIGGKRDFEFGSVKVTLATHGSGVAGGQASGFIVNFYGTKIYFAGDTGLFGDMAFIAKEKVDYAILPIGDNFTMGPEDATEAVGLILPKKVIPMHYNSNPLIKKEPEPFKAMVEKKYGIPVLIMAPGARIIL